MAVSPSNSYISTMPRLKPSAYLAGGSVFDKQDISTSSFSLRTWRFKPPASTQCGASCGSDARYQHGTTAEIEHGQSKDEGFIDGLPCRGERDVLWNGSSPRASMLRPPSPGEKQYSNDSRDVFTKGQVRSRDDRIATTAVQLQRPLRSSS
jgi:hypothetical protein